MKTVKEVLKKQLTELNSEIHSLNEKHEEILSNAAQQTLSHIDEELFKEFKVRISTTDITFDLGGSSWDRFRIQRIEQYSKSDKEYRFGKAELSMSSMSTDKDSDLKVLIGVGKLAEHRLKGTHVWIDLVRLMDSKGVLYKEDISEKIKLGWKLEDEIRKIEREEDENQFKTIFDKGTFKLNRQEYFHYGSGKWDRVSANEWFWEKNEGKTYTVSYTSTYRTNPWRDEQGNELEAVYETKKVAINKRIRSNDIESFVRSNMRYLETE